MALSISTLVNYFTLAYSFYNVHAIRPCDLKILPFDFRSQDTFSSDKPAVNRPLLQESVTTAVNLSLSINDLNILDIKSMDVEIDLGMTQTWYDHRLAPDYKTKKLAVLGAIWEPKITFVVGKKCPDITSSNNPTQFWRGTSNGSVLYSERFLVKPKCTKDLRKYPFDAQICFLKIGSYRFTAEEVSLKWNSEMGIESRVDKELGEFSLQKFRTYNETDIRSSGNFSVLVLEIHLTRYSRREIFQSFLPSFIFVKISYGVFWIELSAIRARIITCQFALAGILFFFKNSNCGVANLAYLKALDIWFLICLLFAFIPLAESLIVRYIHQSNEDFEDETEGQPKSTKTIALWIERILRFLHPAGLLSSVILYFSVFDENR